MSMLYALLKHPEHTALHECFIEGIDLDSMKLHTLITLQSGFPTAFVVAPDQQRVFVADPGLSQVLVYDTAGHSVGKLPMASRPYDCVLTPDGQRLIVSTRKGLVVVDTATLTITIAVPGPYPDSTAVTIPDWIESSAAIALSPDGGVLAVSEGALTPADQAAPPDCWLVNPATLTTVTSFSPPPVSWWLFVYDVAFAGGLILFLAPKGVVGALNPKTGKLATWTELGTDASRTCLNALTWSTQMGRAYVTTGYIAGKILTPYLMAVDPVKGTTEKISGFIGAPQIACADDEQKAIYVAVRHPDASPDHLARVPMTGPALQPSVYKFATSDRSVVAMQTVKGSVFDPPRPGGIPHLEQSVEILIGLTGGGSGWVVTPHGVIKPVDPAPIQPGVPLHNILGRALRAGLVAQSAATISDRKTRELITSNALQYAQQQLAQITR